MKFLAMSRRLPGVADERVAALGEAEALAVFRRMQRGDFDQIHHSHDWKGALLFVRAASRAQAQAMLDELPMVRGGCIAFDLWGLAQGQRQGRDRGLAHARPRRGQRADSCDAAVPVHA